MYHSAQNGKLAFFGKKEYDRAVTIWYLPKMEKEINENENDEEDYGAASCSDVCLRHDSLRRKG